MQWVLSAQPPFRLKTVINSHDWVQLAPFSGIGPICAKIRRRASKTNNLTQPAPLGTCDI